MASVNKVILVGHLGADPEVKSFANGNRVANLRIATSESWRDKASGERKERTEWHSVVITNEHGVKTAEQYLRKGSQVYLEGQLRTRKWQDRDGNDRYSTEVVYGAFRGELVLLDKRPGGRPADANAGDYDGPGSGGSRPAGGGFGGGQTSRGPDDLDDDVPF